MDARYLSESGEYLYGVLLGANENTHYEYWVEFDEGTFSIAADLIEVELVDDIDNIRLHRVVTKLTDVQDSDADCLKFIRTKKMDGVTGIVIDIK